MPEESSLVTGVWAQRSLGIDLPKNLESVASRDVKHVCDNSYPFLQVINSNAVFAEETPINFITTFDGWIIHDYGDAVSVAAPHTSSAENGEKSGMAYQIAAVAEVVQLAVNKGWTSIELIAGTPSMQRLLWIESKRYSFLNLKGYEPSDSDQKSLERLKKRTEDSGLTWKKQIQKNPTNELISISGAS